jgi:hypothetical protein
MFHGAIPRRPGRPGPKRLEPIEAPPDRVSGAQPERRALREGLFERAICAGRP